ncbi:UPF0294 protein VP2298 [Frankliniella fusca]|uniref:UPF0294 protein VP2298 n=1 Tax=Frankliniella fusca TaxID=407009 RepID=A0AAE1GTR9_9NEOP|nr:UPF0294 protein VP2298 [Frankliniella fusca]
MKILMGIPLQCDLCESNIAVSSLYVEQTHAIMPNIRGSRNYKASKKAQSRRDEYYKKRREKKRDQYNNQQKLLMRTRSTNLRNDNEATLLIENHRRRNNENLRHFREREGSEVRNRKRKIAKERWDRCVNEFETAIRQFHSHVCNCCGKMYRISQLKTLNKSNLRKRKITNHFLNKVFWVEKKDEAKFCFSCAKDIETLFRVPKMALSNGLDFPVVDDDIKKLNRIEERLLAPRHVFQTLWTVKGPSGQFKTKGGIVNVPVEVDNTVSSLPRPINDSSMVHVRLARKMEYVKDYMSGVVRTTLLYNAAKTFVQKPLAIEENITLSSDWHMDVNHHEQTNLEDDFYVQNAIYETLLVENENEYSFTGLVDKSLRIAPAEGFRPTSILFDDKCEYLAFPTVFGGYRMTPFYNGKPISYADVAKSMAMRYDRRVAERGDLLLFIAKNLSDALLPLQTHRHTHTCKKKSGESKCRFDIPYFPMKRTQILTPLKEEIIDQERKRLPIKLLDNSGYITKRTKPLVIRFRNYHYETEPDEYLREHLMLYHPWRNEEEDILNQDLEYIFLQNESKIKNIKKIFNAFDDKMINVAVQEAQNRDLNEIDSDSDNHVGETTSETFLLSSKFDFEQYTLDDSVNFDEPRQTTSERRSEVHFTLPTKLHEKDFQELFEKLNQDQRDYVMHVSHHFLTSNEQIFHFLTGGAGMAAFNINGQTLHSAFKIRPNTDVLENLSAGVSNTLACTLHCLKVLIIDEISMNVDNFNDDAIKKIPGPEHICEASDILQGYGTELAKRQLMIIKPLSKTDYLYQEIKRWKRDKIIPVFNNIRDQTAFQIMYHNVQSLPKHINLITNDLNFTCNDVLCFGELWMSQYDTTAIPSYNMIHSIVSRNQRKPIGVCIYVKKAKQKFIKKSGTFTLSASKYRIDTVWLTIHNHTVFALYGTPGTPQQLWKKWFNTMHSLQSGKIIILGDFNFNSQQLPCAFEQLFRKYDLELKNRNMVTTHQKTSLDWIVSNNEQLLTGTYVSYFSYHHPIWARMASCRQ